MISIVTAAYNCELYISETIRSVQTQTYEDWELIIVDDHSTDKTNKVILKAAESDKRIKYIYNENNLGPAKTRNRGIEFAKGQYLTFLDGDDLWLPTFLEVSLRFMANNNCVFTFASYKRVDEELNPLLSDFIVPDKVSYSDILKTCSISCLTAFIDISKVGKHYMPDLKKRQDFVLWLSILKKIDFAYGIKEPLAIYRIRKGSVSRNKFKALQYNWRVYRDVEKFNLLRSTYYASHYIYNGLRKYAR
ncbi:glycosyltransferase family 2 protein [Pontibacter sp. HSC-36F09]|uniref:glycosyltransferase family 2 protein n=1 Tax=Pontibacter sp. HSC-36F09 TaxID=2910966 RepID=UPI0020A12A55|nr:glycosyltransferase family 2 protein [Pontibacter sp. HSC-36F09]MCP2044260.1 glycosyltransferase involved in cell wall biosynthesis [Pontibacter sp. HSC-36F09]